MSCFTAVKAIVLNKYKMDLKIKLVSLWSDNASAA